MQQRFHDHIIHDDKEFQQITNYIIDNPSKWNRDLLQEENVSESIIDYHKCLRLLSFKEDSYIAK
jgi:hypothetical protein